MNTRYQLRIITSTTRPGHKGIAVARWIDSLLQSNEDFETQLLDLAEIDLPMMDEPQHPRLRKYAHAHTKRWSATIDAADAFIIVLGEYNHGFPAPIKNAIDYLVHEWAYKPVAFVTYGGIAGGTRSLQMLKNVIVSLRMTPVVESVNIPFFDKHFDDAGIFNGDAGMEKAAANMMTELTRLTKTLQPLRKR